MNCSSIGPPRRARFECCGSNAWVMRHEDQPERLRIAANYCRDRWCRPCANARAGRAAGSIFRHVLGRTIRFVTLTVQTQDLNLRDSLNKLLDGWKHLKRTKLWKNTQDGGVAFLEIKYSEDRSRWHPHLHLIVEGRYLPQPALRKTWHSITKDSFIVDVRAIPQKEVAAQYVSKYASNPLGKGVWATPERLAEAMEVLKGRKTAATFGTWRGLKLNPEAAAEPWIPLGPLENFIARANDGEPFALAILKTLSRRKNTCKPQPRPPPHSHNMTLFDSQS